MTTNNRLLIEDQSASRDQVYSQPSVGLVVSLHLKDIGRRPTVGDSPQLPTTLWSIFDCSWELWAVSVWPSIKVLVTVAWVLSLHLRSSTAKPLWLFEEQVWRWREKTHASSPSTSGKTHEKTCPIQTRRETRESILVRTDTSFWGLWALIGDLQKEENRFLTEGQKCLTAGLLCWLDTSFPWSSTACCRDMELEFRFLLHLIPPKVEEETELWGRRPTPSTSTFGWELEKKKIAFLFLWPSVNHTRNRWSKTKKRYLFFWPSVNLQLPVDQPSVGSWRRRR